ncbi:PREDICTED: protein FAM166B isoform X2 [Hipposideros armiger]|uniref:Ciliary microtubule inner protein 2B n=1 Tax=Hipposideros armiger TaxID=186990 RepID=A0A8B7SZL7_HIPAR|nr:PREDICTED: protein FAM166B isoform X2 [Hipposideros armiger]
MDLTVSALPSPTSGLPSVLEWGGCSQLFPCPQVAGLHLFWGRQTCELLSCSTGLGPGSHHSSAPSPVSSLSPAPASGWAPQPWTQYTQPRASAQRETKGTAQVPMAVASTFTPGLNAQNPHYIPGYTGHCPLLRFSMGQTYGQVTGQLLRGAPGLAWPPACRILLPPIRPPRSPEVPRGSLPVRRGHERLSSSMIPGYTGFVPQAQFIFAKNCSQVWAEALNDFTQWHGKQGRQELPKEVKGADVQKDQEPKAAPELEAEEPERGQEAGQASLVMCPVPASSSAPAFLCSPTRPCRNLDKCTHRADPRRASNISPHFLGPTLRNWAFYLTMGAMCQGISSSLAALMGISPMMLWASATSRSSSWHRYLDFKFSLPFSSIPAILLEGREMGWRVGGDTKRKWFGGQAPFLLIGVINK